MASHLSSIGFEDASMEAFLWLSQRALDEGEPLGRQARWPVGGGAELWVARDRRGRITGLQPHFAGHARMPVAVERRLRDASAYTWVDPEDEDPESGVYPLIVDLVAAPRVGLPARASAQVAVFAAEIEGFADEEAFEAEQAGEDARFAVESTVPTGTWAYPPAAECLFHGRVLESGVLTNAVSGVPYTWLRARTLGGEVDVVADRALLGDPPPPHGVVRVMGWVSARLYDAVELPSARRGLRRLRPTRLG